MALSFAHGLISINAFDPATTVYTVSGLSFAPVALRFYWMGRADTSSSFSGASNDSNRGVGFAVSTSSRRCVGTHNTRVSGNADCGTVACDDCICVTVDGSGARVGRLDINSFTSDGFTVIVDAQFTSSPLALFYEAWGGSDITVAAIGDIAEPAATGDQNYTVTGFVSGAADQVVMFAGVQSVSALNTGEAQDSGLHVGFAASTTAADNITVCGNSDDNSATMDTDGYCQDGECLSMIVIAGGTSVNARATLTAFGTNNFTLNWAARATSNRRSIFLAIKGGQWKSGAYTIDGSTGSATATVSGLAFAPIGLSTIGRMTIKNTSATSTVDDRLSIGTGTSISSRRTMGHLDEDATASVEIDLTVDYTEVLAYPSTTGTLQSAYDINAMNSDGFQIIVDTAGGVANEWHGYLTFAQSVADVLYAQACL
jgi:hypothetical protein